ncbi:chitosanase [Metarhizium album ARSEF 1941]|uniref:Endo-chitosanase n=1 Tax=Metarhizium album (strain ARSEF 1941) TaxID=1081103 RepID=A0A0B2X4A4_METAS|nr:chitosanase [Metarhizium album ARSEF 1941]KHO00593.1 chitosanase [Metarhizium album ARSEF 1941]
MLYAVFAVAALFALGSAYEIPPNLKRIYDAHKNGSCSKPLSSPMSSGMVYCGDVPGAIFLKGQDSYDNLDIDCDGANNYAGDCANDPTGQSQTAFKANVSQYGISDLDANIHSYVVLGNEGPPAFDPQSRGIQPLSVVAVVCGEQLFFGVWGDVNGGNLTGETSIALGKLCFPDEGLNGNNGHDAQDVLYLAFPGAKAVPGKDEADWRANSTMAFMDSIKDLGNKLVAQLRAKPGCGQKKM